MLPEPFAETPPLSHRQRFKDIMISFGFSVAITSVYTALLIALKTWFN